MAKRISVDVRLESYKSFFDHQWSRKINRLVDGTALDDAVFDLAMAWKAAANTHAMPWLMAHQLKHFYAGVMRADGPYGFALVNSLLARLTLQSRGSIPADVIEELRALLRQISLEIGVKREQIAGEFNPQKPWGEFLELSEFRLSVWGSQRLAYGALYYAYEDFLLRSFKLVTREFQYQIRGKEFAKDFGREFGTRLRDDCWSHPQVHVARLTRHALVHNGGRVTDSLKKLNHGLSIESGEIQIMAPDTSAVFDLLKDRAFRLAVEIVQRLSSGAVA